MFRLMNWNLFLLLQIIFLSFPSETHSLITAKSQSIVLSSAVFGSDGMTVDVTFSGNTNKGDQLLTFGCDTLFTFEGNSDASCLWISDSRMRVSLTASADVLVSVQSIITVKTDTIRPLSDLTSFIPSSSIAIAVAVDAITPGVIISAPHTVGICDSPAIDVTTSTGACGRDWKSAVLEIESIPLTVTLGDHNIFPPIQLPIGMLTAGYDYSFRYTLCNFMDVCGTSVHIMHATNVKTPIVVIQGQAVRQVYTQNSLLLTADGYTANCDGTKSSSDVTYSWSVYADGVLDTSIVSTSTDPKKFKVAEFILRPLVVYTMTVTGSSIAEGTQSSTSVMINVAQSDLVLITSGGSQRSARIGEAIEIDASDSYDSDYAPDAGITELRFEFDCIALPITDPVGCDLTLVRLSSSVRITPQETSPVGSVHAIKVTVFDVGGTRNTSKFVYITTDEAHAPVVNVEYSSAAKINPSDTLQLLGSIEATVSNTARWVLVDPGAIVLSDIAQTDVTKDFSAGSHSFNLVVASYSLTGRDLPYVFSLYADESYSSIEITINTPPIVGKIEIDPTSGVEMDTRFLVEASRWVDDDMPLSYQFGYENPKDSSILIVRGRAEIAFADTTLPSGGASRDNKVLCTVKVFDFLNAFTVGSEYAVVEKLNITSSALGALVTDNLDAAAGDVDGTKEVLSVATSVANNQDCSSLPYDCANELFRADCYDTANTCGPCLDGYMGTEGDDNSICVLVGGRRSLSASSTGCYVDSDCGSAWEYCDTGENVCKGKPKECNNDCSGHGTCSAVDSNTGELFSGSCVLGMTSCEAVCDCDPNFHGSTCTMNDEDYVAKQDLRETLLSTFKSVTLGDDTSQDAVEGWLQSLNAMATSTQEMSLISSSLAIDIAEYILDNAETVKVHYSVLLDLMKAIDVANRAATGSEVTRTNALLDKFNLYVASNVLEGQAAVSSIQSSFRSLTQILSGDGSPLSSSLPLSDAELLSGVIPSSVSVETTSGSAVSFSISSMKSKEFNSGNRRLSGEDGTIAGNPVRANIAAASTEQVTFMMQNTAAQSYYTNEGEPHRTICLEGDMTHTPYACDNGDGGISTLWHNCTGEKAILESPCPTVSYGPTCQLLNDDATYDCVVKSYTATQTECLCTRTDGGTRRRRVLRNNRLQGSEALEESGAIEVASVSTLVVEDFSATIISTGDLTLGDLQEAVIIFILYASLWGGGMLGLSLCTLRRRKLTKISGVVRSEFVKKQQRAASAKNNKDVKKYLLSYIDEVFPAVYRGADSMFSRAWSEISKHHKYLVLFTAKGRNSESVRMLTGVYVLTMQTMLMFILAVCYDLEFPQDDGTCLTHETRSSCTSEKSVFDNSKSKCDWMNPDSDEVEYVDNTDIGGLGFIPSCEYVQPAITVKTIVIISVIVAVMTGPLEYLIDFLFWSVIDAPTADSLKMQEEETLLARTVRNAGRRVSNVAQSVAAAGRRFSNAIMTVPERRKSSFSLNVQTTRGIPDSAREAQVLARASFSDIIDDVKQATAKRRDTRVQGRQTFLTRVGSNAGSQNPILPKADYARLKVSHVDDSELTIDELFDDMVVDMMEQRSNLLPDETTSFDREWGLENGELKYDSNVVFDGTCCSKKQVSRVEEVIKSELEFVQKQSHMKYDKLRTANDQQIGLEILHLFVLDLLGRDTPVAKIFLAKSEEDFRHEFVVTRQAKIVAWVVVILLNFFFILFSLLRGIERGTEWQKLFAMACALQFVLEIVFYETTECLIVNFTIPDLVKTEVVAVGNALRSTITQVCDMKYSTSSEGLVAIDHDSPVSSPRGISPRMVGMTDANLFLDAPRFLFVSNGVSRKFPNLLESAIVQSYHTYRPGELSKKWVKGVAGSENDDIGGQSNPAQKCLMKSCPWAFNSRSHGTGRIGFTFGITFILVQLMIRFGASSPRLQRIVIHSIQPMVMALLVLVVMFIADNPAFLALIAVVAVYKLYYCYRDQKLQRARKSDEHMLLGQDDEEGDDEGDLERGESGLTLANLRSQGRDGNGSNSRVPGLDINSMVVRSNRGESDGSSEDDNISLSMPRLPKLPSEVSDSSSSSEYDEDDDSTDSDEPLRRAPRRDSKGRRKSSHSNKNIAFEQLETIYSNNNSMQLNELPSDHVLLGEDEINHDFEFSDENEDEDEEEEDSFSDSDFDSDPEVDDVEIRNASGIFD